MTEFHVAIWGDDASPGTPEQPFASLDRARDAAREAAGTAPADVVVNLHEGTYPLAAPFVLTGADSGSAGRIVYQAHGYGTGEPEEVVVSGGRPVTGWRVEDGVWLAEVGGLDTRQLYVDGRRAERAGIDGLPGAATKTGTGYIVEDSGPLNWQHPSDVEFVYRGVYPWTEARCAVASVTGTGPVTITMVQPAFEWANSLYNFAYEGHSGQGPGLPSRVENDTSFLTEPGTFVLDRSRPGHHVLRYLPRPGEHPASTQVLAPVLETLVHLQGTSRVCLRGLTFADATWLQPGREKGFLHYHSNGFYEGGPVQRVTFGEGAWVTVPGTDVSTIPACVVVEKSAQVEIEGCRFTRLGASGLEVAGGAEVAVRGCDFDTLSATAISVTGTAAVLIEDNWIHHTGLDYAGSPGVSVANTQGCTITHNEVTDVPHCGIVAGPAEGTRILHNLTARTMGVLADGGGVYISGPQGDSHDNGAVIRGNVIKDTLTPYNFGLYTDYGAAWVLVTENVVVRADSTAVLTVAPPLANVVYRNNVWDTDPVGADDPPAGVTYEDNATVSDEEELNSATASLRAQAGLLHPRR